MSGQLRQDVEQWASDYDRQVLDRSRGPGGFRTQAASQAFAERGRVLVDLLQAELGDGWHVEYWPNHTAFLNGQSPGNGRSPNSLQRGIFANALLTRFAERCGFRGFWRKRKTRMS